MDQKTGLSAGQQYLHRPRAWLRQAPVLATLLALAGTALAAPPDSLPIPDQNATQGVAFDFDTSPFFSDPEAGALTFVANGLPPSLAIDPVSGAISGTPTNADAQDSPFSVAITVTDAEMLSAQETFTLTVANVNDPPAFTSSPSTTGSEGTPYSYTMTATDADGNALTFAAPTLPAWLTFNGTNTLSGTPQQADVGTHNVTVTVSDGIAAAVPQSFQIVVANVNDAPVFTSSPATTGSEGSPYSYTMTATDADGNALTFAAPTLPAWLTFNGTNTLSGTPQQADVGTHNVTVTVSDGIAAAVPQSFQIVVANVNDAPVFTSSPATTGSEGSPYSYTMTATDADGNALTFAAPTLPAWLTFNGTNTLSGTPQQADVGTHNVTVTVSDGIAAAVPQSFQIVVANVNDAPVFTSSPATTGSEGSPYSYTMTATDADGNALTFAAPTLPAWLTFNGTNTLSGTPQQANVGTHNVTVTVSDGIAAAVPHSFQIVVANVNDPAVANPDAYLIDEDQVLSVAAAGGVLTNDTDADNDALTAALVTNVAHGTLTLNANGSFTYTPNANYNGADGFTYRANDGTVSGNTATVALTINPVNDAPAFTTSPPTAGSQGTLYSYTMAAADADGNALTFAAPTLPAWLTFNGTNTLSGTPQQANVGTHNVTVTVSDGIAAAVPHSFQIVVANVNDPPTVTSPIPDQAGAEKTPFGPLSVAGNFSDADADTLTFSANFPATSGLSISSSGTISGTPTKQAGKASPFNVTITANDGHGGTVSDVVQFTIAHVNDPPTFTSTAPTTANQGTAYSYTLTATDPDDDTLTFAAPTLPAWLTFNGTNTLSGTPQQADVGTHNVTVTVSDGIAAAVPQSFQIVVANVNDPAVANPDAYLIDEDQVLSVAAAGGVLTNDTDADNDALTAALVTNVAHGTLTLNANGSFTYTPNANYNGADGFTYRANDGTVSGNTATVALTINPVNDAPVAAADAYTVNEDTTLTVNVGTGVLANDSDADGTALAAAVVNSPSHGTLALAANGSFTYKPDADFNGADAFSYHASDGVLTSTTVNVAITVSPVDDAPAPTGPISAPNAIESLPYSFDLAPFFTDTEGDRLYFQASSGAFPTGLPQSGNLKVDVDGSQTGVAGRLFGTPALADTSDQGPRLITLTVGDRPASDPQRKTTVVQFELTIQKLDRVDLSLTVHANPSPVAVGTAVQWTFTVSNANPLVTVGQVTLTATFSGLPFTVTNAGPCSANGSVLSCTAGPVPPQGTVDVSITGQAAQPGDVIVTSEVHIASTGGPAPVDPNQSNNTATATLNVGQSFSTGPAQTISGSGAMRAAAAGDIDGDHFTDLVLAAGAGSGTQVFFSVPKDPNDPNGAEFRRLSTSPVSLGDADYDGQGVLLVDLDGDGDLDLVVANGSPGHPEGNIVMLNELNAGQANFVPTGAPLGNRVSYAVAAADLDGNGSPDLVFANAGPNEIFLNLGNGSFAPAASLGNSDSRSLVVTDLDGDQLPDIVFANSDGPSLAYRNLGGGKFAAPVAVATAPAVAVRAADFGGDGLPDLVFGRVTAAPPDLPSNDVYINTSVPGTLSFSGPAATLGASPTPELAVADFTMDGISDIVALNSTGTHQIFAGAGSGTFSLNAQQFSSSAPTGEAVGDFNNDGRPDLAVASATGAAIFLNDGHGNLGPGDLGAPTLQLLGQPSVTLTVGDTYADAGATATDAVDGDITQRIAVANPVNALVLGTYTVTYNVSDRSGNKAAPLTRTVVVGARQASGGGGGATDPLFLAMLASLVFWGILGRLRRSPRGEER